MISEKQRRRALAHAKWERQNARRTAMQKRSQRLSIIFGTATAVVLIGFAGWGVHHLVTNDSNSPNSPAITYETPTDTGMITSYSPPATTSGTSTGKPTGSTKGTSTGSASSTPNTSAPTTSGATR